MPTNQITLVEPAQSIPGSAFQGFYGQIGTGYESNSASDTNFTATSGAASSTSTWAASNQASQGGTGAVGIGYNFVVSKDFLLGIGADYSPTGQSTSPYGATHSGSIVEGSQIATANGYNIFLAPGYAIDKDKLAYFKAGYRSAEVVQTFPASFTPQTGSANVSGYVLGLGYKQIITGGFYGFGEVDYMSYGKPSFNSTFSGYQVTSNPSITSYQLLVGVGYKF